MTGKARINSEVTEGCMVTLKNVMDPNSVEIQEWATLKNGVLSTIHGNKRIFMCEGEFSKEEFLQSGCELIGVARGNAVSAGTIMTALMSEINGSGEPSRARDEAIEEMANSIQNSINGSKTM